MKITINPFLILFLLTGISVLISCENDWDNSNLQTLESSAYLVNTFGCKNGLISSLDVKNTLDSLSCVEYYFDAENNRLTLKHINAEFNCCPDSLFIQTSFNGDTIIIQEYEAKALHRCNCLYDLEIDIEGIMAQNYLIKFIEPYVTDQPEILFEADLENSSEGSFCVTRIHYPWNVDNMGK